MRDGRNKVIGNAGNLRCLLAAPGRILNFLRRGNRDLALEFPRHLTGRNVTAHHRIGPDDDVIADRDSAENLAAQSKNHFVTNLRHTLTPAVCLVCKADPGVNNAVIANDDSVVDRDAKAGMYFEASSNHGAGTYVRPITRGYDSIGQHIKKTHQLANEWRPELAGPMSKAVIRADQEVTVQHHLQERLSWPQRPVKTEVILDQLDYAHMTATPVCGERAGCGSRNHNTCRTSVVYPQMYSADNLDMHLTCKRMSLAKLSEARSGCWQSKTP